MWFDFPVLDFIQKNIHCDFLDPIMAGLSIFADKGIGLVILCVIFLIPKKTRSVAAMGLASLAFVGLFGELVLKNIVCRPRPFEMYQEYHRYPIPFTLNVGAVTGYSFPSCHTACAFAVATVAFKVNKITGVVATIIAALIGFSRLYNYVHYPTDVIAGMLFGVLTGVLMIVVFKKTGLENKLNNIGNKS